MIHNPKSEQYWLAHLSGELNVIDIKQYNSSGEKEEKQFFDLILSPEDAKKINALISNSDIGRFVYFYNVVAILLHKYTGQQDVLITTLSLEDAGVPGNLLFLRKQLLNQNLSAKLLLEESRQLVINSFQNQDCSYKILLDKLFKEEVRSEIDLSDILFLDSKLQKHTSSVDPYSLVIITDVFEDSIKIRFQYTKCYEAGFIKMLAGHFNSISGQIIDNLNIELENIGVLSPQDKTKIISEFNDTDVCYEPESLPLAFHRIATSNPKNIALSWKDEYITYEWLDRYTDMIAGFLTNEKGIKPGDIVAVNLPSSFDLLMSMLAVLKTGAAVLPIDISIPAERANYMLSNSSANLLIISGSENKLLSENVLSIETIKRKAENYWEKKPEYDISPQNVAYIIYTSGSTGNPKGIKLTHSNLGNFFNWFVSYFKITRETVFAQKTTINFIDSVAELLLPLTSSGGTVYLRPYDDIVKEPLALFQWLTKIKTEIVQFVPSVFDYIHSVCDFNELTSLKYLILSGEELKKRYEYPFDIYNLYGCSECTSVSSVYKLKQSPSSDKIYIGRPISNTQMYVLNDKLELVVPFLKGELYIGGKGISPGYINSGEELRQRFINNPFRKGEYLFKSGDIAAWDGEGNLSCFGRKDDQLKIFGYRIELGEIEAVLLKNESITKACVIAEKGINEQIKLIAFITVVRSVELSEVRNCLREYFPDFVIPAKIIFVDTMPLNANGKIDKKELKKHTSRLGESHHMKHRNDHVVEGLLRIWRELFEKDNIGVSDNFFELGGHSLLATQMVLKIHSVFGVEVKLKEIFDNQTILEIAELIRPESRQDYVQIPILPKQKHYELSRAQKRLWIVSQFSKTNVTYNISSAFILNGVLNRVAFIKSVEDIVSRHEVLRTNIVVVDGEPLQEIKDGYSADTIIRFSNICTSQYKEEDLRKLINAEIKKPFNMESDSLFRINLIQTEESKYVFIYTLHHIISDRWSSEVLSKEFIYLYNTHCSGGKAQLKELPVQYKDYARWHNGKAEDVNAKTYWAKEFEGTLPVLKFPTDRPRPVVKTYNGSGIADILDANLYEKLNNLAYETGTSLYMVLLSAVKALLFRYTNQSDFIIGTSVAGRDHVALQDQIGFYANLIGIRSYIGKNDTFEDVLLKMKEKVLSALEYQFYPFDKLINDLKIVRDPSRLPLFDNVVVLQNAKKGNRESIEMKDISILPYAIETVSNEYDLAFYFEEQGDLLEVKINYNTDLFESSSIKILLEKLKLVLSSIGTNRKQNIQAIEIELGIERQLKGNNLIEFNF